MYIVYLKIVKNTLFIRIRIFYTTRLTTTYSISLDFINYCVEQNKNKINKRKLIKMAYEYIEKNKIIFKYKDIELYQHQKDLFTTVKRPYPKLIYYQAPTGTGKTISPIGLANGKKVIFSNFFNLLKSVFSKTKAKFDI